jgi:hypothetical protein
MSHLLCHSDPAVAGEESLIKLIGQTAIRSQRCFASLNMTDGSVHFFS